MEEKGLDSPGQLYAQSNPFTVKEPDFVAIGTQQAPQQEAAPQGDPFAELRAQAAATQQTAQQAPTFGVVKEAPQTQVPEQPSAPASAPENPQQTDSEAERVRREFEAYRQQVEQVAPILQLIQSDRELAAEVFGAVEKRLRPKEEAAPQEQPPQPPERPSGYNEADAYSDPSSESWRYRVAQEKYERDALRFEIKQANARAERAERALQQAAEQARQQQEMTQLAIQVAQQRGVGLEQAINYVQFITNPQVSQDDLWALYQLKMGRTPATQPAAPQPAAPQLQGYPQYTPPQAPTQTDIQAQAMQYRNNNLAYPLPAAVAAGSSAAKSPSDALFDSLKSMEMRRNPFQ